MVYYKYIIGKIREKTGAMGIETILSIALAIIIAGFILIPGLRLFTESVMSSMNIWWSDTVKSGIFPNS